MNYKIRENKVLKKDDILFLYRANKWSSAEKPEKLFHALLNSHSLITAWDGEKLIGLGNAISDGFLVVYFPHLLVHPDYHQKGIGAIIMERLKEKYKGFHQQILVADENSVGFYEKCGFNKAGNTQAMWIYQGNEH